MGQHPVAGLRTLCIWLMGGVAGCAWLPTLALADSSSVGVPAARAGGIPLTSAKTQVTTTRQAPTVPRTAAPRPAFPHQPPQRAASDPLFAARQLEERGDLLAARKAYTAILQQHPRHAECLHRLAVVCTRLNDLNAAHSLYERALELSPENVTLLSDAGYARFLSRDYAQAEKFLRKATVLAPRDVRAHNNLAVVLGVTGRLDEALALFQKVNNPAHAWMHMAYIYQLRKEPQLAYLCYQRAQALDPGVKIPQELLVHAQTATSVVVAEADLPPSPSQSPKTENQLRQIHPLEELVSTEESTDTVLIEVTAEAVTQVVRPEMSSEAEPAADKPVDSEDLSWIESEKAKLAQRGDREGLKGFCPVVLCEERKLVDAQEQFSAEYQGQTYHFSSSDAVEKFRAQPEKYAPVAGGLDIVAVRQASEVVSGSLDHAVWYRDKLYLFSSPQRKADFCANPRSFVPEAQ